MHVTAPIDTGSYMLCINKILQEFNQIFNICLK